MHTVSKNLSEHSDKIDEALKTEIEGVISDAKSLSSEASVEDIKAKVSALSSASMKIGQAMYSNGKSGEASESEPAAKEAEYTESKNSEEKK